MSFDLDNLLGLLFFVVFIVLPIFARGNKKAKGQQPQGPAGRRPSTGPSGAPQQAASAQPRSVPLPGQPTASADRGASSTITLEEIRRRVEDAQRRELESRRGAQASTATPGSAGSLPATRPPRRGLVSSDPFENTLVGDSTVAGMGREGVSVSPESGYQAVIGREGTRPQSQARPTVLGREGSLPSGSARSPGVLGREGLAGREGPSGAARRAPRSTGTPGPLGREGADRSARAAAAVIGATSDLTRRQGGAAGSKLSPIGPLRFDRPAIMQGLIWHEILGEPPSIRRLRRTRSRLH